jgi:glutamine synthetase
MNSTEIVMVCCSDIAGQVRGKGFPADHLTARQHKGVGWTPTNLMITAHGAIADGPWGALGDLVLLPDLSTHTRVDFGDDTTPEHFVLGHIRELDGQPWECCPKHFLDRAITALHAEFGLEVKAAFEHEFHYDGAEERPNSNYALDAFRRQGAFAGSLLWALGQAEIRPDTFMPEYGPAQYEVTIEPAIGARAADDAVILRELTRASAARHGAQASFTPILRPDTVGNGVHVHFSLRDAETGQPINHDPDRDHGLSTRAGAFLAGIQTKLPALTALTAASTISYLRLVPNRWSAAFNNLGLQDREAALRICPVFETTGAEPADQFHFEYRAADAAASPYMVLGGLIWAGLDGLRQNLPAPVPTTTDAAAMDAAELTSLGLQRLPQSLTEALDLLAADDALRDWMGPLLHEAYLCHKRFEADLMAPLSPEEQCQRYALVY